MSFTRKPLGLQPVSRVVQLAVESARCLWIPHGDRFGLLIDGTDYIFQDVGHVREDICARGVDLKQAVWLNRKLRANNDMTERSLNDLKWCAAFLEYKGEMPGFLRRDDIIGMSRWPPFIDLPYTDDFLRIADLLTRRPTSPAFAARLLKLDETTLNHFYYTAWHADCIEHINRKEFHRKVAEQYHHPRLSMAANLKDLLTTDLRELVDFSGLAHMNASIKTVLTTDVVELWHSPGMTRFNKTVASIMKTDVMDILTADLLAPFKNSSTTLQAPVSLKTLDHVLKPVAVGSSKVVLTPVTINHGVVSSQASLKSEPQSNRNDNDLAKRKPQAMALSG